MVNAQEWLNRKYPTPEAKAAVKRIGPNQDPAKKIGDDLLSAVTKGRNLSSVFSSFLDNVVNKNDQLEGNLNLEGSLSFKGFINLEELDISNQKITALDISDCSQLRDLDCSNNRLADLNLSNNLQIEYINFSNNQLTDLNLTGLTKVEKIFCSDNQLTSLEFLKSLNPTEIRTLRMGNNQFPAQDLNCFAQLTGLNRLFIENIPFYGSLKPLRNLNEIKEIGIVGTDIDSGIEYLPEDFFKVDPTASRLGLRGGYFKRTLYCSGKLAEQLKDYEVKDNPLMNYDWPRWRRDNAELIARANRLLYEELKRKNEHAQEKLSFETESVKDQQQETKPLKKQSQFKPTLNHFIGRGGYGEVYYGKWKLQDVAVKKLYLSLNNISRKDLKEIMNEINLLKELRNRYIIQYYDTYSDDQELLIIMDFAENGTLTKFINDNKEKDHNWNFDTNIVKQIALGLAYIHQEGVIHRDLKSMNILLTNNYQVKISDFGLSRTKIVSSSQSKYNVAGTLRWMAPEVIREQKYSEQSDIYALGMIIWEIAAKCTLPFKDLDNNLVMFKIFNNGKETIPTDEPENIQNIITQCWKDSPNERIALVSVFEIIEGGLMNSQTNFLESQNNQYLVSKDVDINLSKLNLQENQPTELQIKNSWTNIHPDFTPELKRQWEKEDFTYWEIKEWIDIGLHPSDLYYVQWLRDIKQVDSDWVLNYGNHQVLRREYQVYQQQAQILHQPLGTPGSPEN